MDWIGIAAVITAIGSLGLGKMITEGVSEIRKARKAELAEQIEAALQKERAETYRRESTATIRQKNDELSTVRDELHTTTAALHRMVDTELPRMQRKTDQQTEIIDRLSRSYEALAEKVAS